MQDQCRFTDENGNWIEFDENFGSNHGGRYKDHGAWVKPVFPAAMNFRDRFQHHISLTIVVILEMLQMQ